MIFTQIKIRSSPQHLLVSAVVLTVGDTGRYGMTPLSGESWALPTNDPFRHVSRKEIICIRKELSWLVGARLMIPPIYWLRLDEEIPICISELRARSAFTIPGSWIFFQNPIFLTHLPASFVSLSAYYWFGIRWIKGCWVDYISFYFHFYEIPPKKIRPRILTVIDGFGRESKKRKKERKRSPENENIVPPFVY